MAIPGDIRKELSSLENVTDAAERVAERLEGHDRSAIAKRVVLLYIATVLACFVFIIGVFWFLTPCTDTATSGCIAWQGPAEFLLQVLTTAVLPIVTLVLGYYFGTAKNDSGGEP